jgi:hypothetical protein
MFDTVGEAVNDLKGASNRYLHYFGRDLDSSEIDAALGEVVEMQAASLVLTRPWAEAIVTTAKAEDRPEIEARVATDLMTDGAMALRMLGPCISAAAHLSNQCSRLTEANLLDGSKEAAAKDAEQLMQVVAAGIERDVRTFEGRITVLHMESQAAAADLQANLNKRIAALTRATTWLTVVIVVAAILTLIISL